MSEFFRRPNFVACRTMGLAFITLFVFAEPVLPSKAMNVGMGQFNTMVAPATKLATWPINISVIQPIIAEATPPTHGQTNAENIKQRWRLAGLMVVLLAIAVWYLRSRKKSAEGGK